MPLIDVLLCSAGETGAGVSAQREQGQHRAGPWVLWQECGANDTSVLRG